MDLIYIARKYRNIRIMLTIIILVIVLINIILVVATIKHKFFKSAVVSVIEQIEENSNSSDNTDEGIYAKTPILTEVGKEKIQNIYKSETKQVFLTFDDGPSKKVTIPILDLLKQENIKATFFVLGSRVELYPEIVKREYEEGHYIANHGYSHIYSQIYYSKESVLEEYNKTNDCIKNAIGNYEYNSQLFRFPGGSKGGKYSNIKLEAAQLINDNNIAYVDWNALSGDSEGITDVEGLVNRVKETINNKNSVVLLMHDARDKTYTLEALPKIIEYLRQEQYEFKNFYDIIQ